MTVRATGSGGDGWESNPPRTPQQRPADGFEDRGEHQLPNIPEIPPPFSSLTIRDLDAYSITNWGLAFAATASAAAGLTGLLFVALSINLQRITSSRFLINRAIEVLVLLVAALILSTLLLMPGEPNGVVAAEIIGFALGASFVVGSIQVRADRTEIGITKSRFAFRVIGSHVGQFFLLVGALSLITQTGGGLYWVVPALLAEIVAAIVGAWVLLVEIVR